MYCRPLFFGRACCRLINEDFCQNAIVNSKRSVQWVILKGNVLVEPFILKRECAIVYSKWVCAKIYPKRECAIVYSIRECRIVYYRRECSIA